MNIAIAYTFFAIIATLVNLFSQWVVFNILDWQYEIVLAMLMGTLMGLITKFYFDKIFIFKDRASLPSDVSKQFVIYAMFGVFTTIIFWVFELSFDAIFSHESAKYIGAALGLSIGYLIKYALDKRYVFNQP